MNVPRLLVLTDRHACEEAGRDLETTVAAALDAGAPAVLYREKDLTTAERTDLGERIARRVHDAGATLVVASDLPLADHLGAAALHLAVADPVPPGRDHGRSCHDGAELRRAADDGAVYATVSPVAPTPSKPGHGPALGVEAAGGLAAAAGLPVLALGGVTVDDAAKLHAAGFHGVAVMGAVMRAGDPRHVVRGLLAAVGS